jgi:hypothetical protein
MAVAAPTAVGCSAPASSSVHRQRPHGASIVVVKASAAGCRRQRAPALNPEPAEPEQPRSSG